MFRSQGSVLTSLQSQRPSLNFKKSASADYDVAIRMNRSDAALAISTARAALERFGKASQQEQLAFLSLLLFSPR
jgi:hypothetical protein